MVQEKLPRLLQERRRLPPDGGHEKAESGTDVHFVAGKAVRVRRTHHETVAMEHGDFLR